MFCSVLSMGLTGIQGYMVNVEVDCQRGMPQFDLVGLPDAAVKESRERVRSAAKNLGLSWPEGRVLEQVTLEEYKALSELFEEDVYQTIDLAACVARRTSQGGTGPASVQSQLRRLEAFLARM